ncbi:hypothetical protein [Clostridium sp. VAP52]|uniref:hypothetical protein n=1 Tax=Clostridium sp. VAP52 TaxID=2949977 RepID=UPI002079C0B0|nr:hypothetical protein [Clostridium sp. VAP52]
MNLNEQLIQVIDTLCEKFGIAIDWTNSNIVPYLQELSKRIVNYDLTKRTISALFGICILMLCLYTIKFMCKDFKKEEDGIFFCYSYGNKEMTFLGIVALIIIIFSSIFFTVGIFTDISHIIQDIFLPEQTILEFARPYLQ